MPRTNGRRKGFKLALVSNSRRPLVRKILAAIGLGTEMFDAVVTSSDAEPKPSHASFKLAMTRLGCTPGHTVYVGHRIDSELRPAHELGITSILVAPGTDDQSSQYVDLALEDVTKLPEALTRRETAALSILSSADTPQRGLPRIAWGLNLWKISSHDSDDCLILSWIVRNL